MGALTNPVSGVAAGTIAHFAANTVPPGWLAANGAAVSRTAYAALFLAIGTTYGAGDGSTTFGLPDLRGEFLRGLDSGRGVDTGRAIGSAQGHQFGSHSHTYPRATSNENGGAMLGGSPSGVSTSSTAGGTTNGSETRPRNVAALACIKF